MAFSAGENSKPNQCCASKHDLLALLAESVQFSVMLLRAFLSAQCPRTVDDVRETLISLSGTTTDARANSTAKVPLDKSSACAEARLDAPEVHDSVYLVFRRFGDGKANIDAGANSGYSAISIWASGSEATVL
jgi:hypothetical protein